MAGVTISSYTSTLGLQLCVQLKHTECSRIRKQNHCNQLCNNNPKIIDQYLRPVFLNLCETAAR